MASEMGLDGKCYAQVTYLSVGIFMYYVFACREAGVVMRADHTVFTPRGPERLTPPRAKHRPAATESATPSPAGLLMAGCAPIHKPAAALLSIAAKNNAANIFLDEL
jgi:hypothetical protein